MPNDEGKLKTTASMDALCQALVAEYGHSPPSVRGRWCPVGGDNPLLEMMPSAACDYRIKVIPIENSGLPQPIKPVILAASGTNHGKKNQRAFHVWLVWLSSG